MEYLKRVGLKGYETHPATELSSGQKQRLSIARALAKNTGIIIADEPTGNLDSETGRQIVELLKELSKESLVIMVTHNYYCCFRCNWQYRQYYYNWHRYTCKHYQTRR